MVYQTDTLIIHIPSNPNFLFFVFFATITSYSFHWYLTNESVIHSPRIDWGVKHRFLHLSFLLLGLIGVGIFAYYLLPYWHWLAASAVITFFYSAPKIPHPLFRSLRKIAVGKTLFLAIVWMFVTTILPMEIAELPWQHEYYFFIAHRFFLIYAICILFDYRDREDDKVAGIRSLISYLSEENISRVFYLMILLCFVASISLYYYGITILQILILLLPVGIVSFIFTHHKTRFTDLLYYFVLDGMMAFSSILMLIPGI